MKSNFIFKGKVIDTFTNKVIHKTETDNIEDFEDMFTEPMRRKLR